MTSDNTSECFYLSDVSPVDKPWDVHRGNAAIVQTLYETVEYNRYADRIKDCSQSLGFAFEATDEGELKLRLREARFCRVRFCPVCQWRRSLMWRARFLQAVPKVVTDHPTARWVFLTLTVKNCPIGELRSTIQTMNRAWNRMTVRKKFVALGFVRSTEVTRPYECYDGSHFLGVHGLKWVYAWEEKNKRKLRLVGTMLAHPHFHVLLMMPSSYFGKDYLSQSSWSQLWRDCLRVDYQPMVNVKAVKPKSGDNGIQLAILETLKYGVKEDDLMADPEWLMQLTQQLYKTRAVSVGGLLKAYINDEEPDDLISGDEAESLAESEVSFWFGWREMIKRYVKENR